MERRRKSETLSEQMKRRSAEPRPKRNQYDGVVTHTVSTGSTLLDLAISGGRVRGGGIPTGILVEIFGPSGSGKTVLISELAGDVQRGGGQVMFHDPEARLNKQFAQIFDLDVRAMEYSRPDTVTKVFEAARTWAPGKGVHGVFADSLAALSTDLEMDKDEGDKMGMRRAREFSEQLRKTCRVLAERNYLMVCSNQIRQNVGATYGPKYRSPGGEAIAFYSSLRLRTGGLTKIKKEVTYKGRTYKQVIGVTVDVEVFKSSVWEPYHTAPLTIQFDYGVDDIRENLRYIKSVNKHSVYYVGNTALDKALEKSIMIVERDGLIEPLREEVIDTWMEIDSKFDSDRKPKKR